MTGRPWAAIPCLLFVAACGGGTATSGGVGTPSATVAATATATAAPTPTPDLRAIAAQQYLAAVTAYNAVNDATNAANGKVKNTAPWSALVPAERALYTALNALEQAVFAIHFPPDIAADVSTVVSTLNAELTTLGDFIRSPGLSTWNVYSNASTAGGSASNAIRHDLGLPPVPIATP